MKFHKALALGLVLSVAVGSASVVTAAVPTQTNGQILCGLEEQKWEPGTLIKGSFKSFRAKIAQLQKKLPGTSGQALAALQSSIAKLQKKRTRQFKGYCRSLALPVRVSSLAQLPSSSGLVRQAQVQDSAVSGVPPTLSEIAAGDVTAMFWRPGVIDALMGGSPDGEQCSEFWVGQSDGVSGGMSACNLAQGVGYSLSPIVQAGVSLCYMKAVPTDEHVSSGLIEVAAGELPEGGITKVFSPPAGEADRIVVVQVSGPQSMNMFIKVRSAAANQRDGYQYRAELWSCAGANEAVELQQLSVSTDGEYKINFAQQEEGEGAGVYKFAVSAHLAKTPAGVVFDTSKDRTAEVGFQILDGVMAFKGQITVTPENLILNKFYNEFVIGWQRAMTVSHYQGNNVQGLRFLEGAFKYEDHNFDNPVNTMTGATEYRDTFYAAAPGNELVSLVNGVDFATDEFLVDPPSVEIDLSAYSCAAEPDLVLRMHGESAAGASLMANCEQGGAYDTAFCQESEELMAARLGWALSCIE